MQRLFRRITFALVAIATLSSPGSAQIPDEFTNLQFLPDLQTITGRAFDTVDTLYASEDQLEGALAFAEKRDPVWKGK